MAGCCIKVRTSPILIFLKTKGIVNMKAVITVIGKDTVGIIAGVSALCADHNVNIMDITQSVMREYFAMIMLADIRELNVPFADFVDELTALGKEKGLEIHTMHEDIFNSMHKI